MCFFVSISVTSCLDPKLRFLGINEQRLFELIKQMNVTVAYEVLPYELEVSHELTNSLGPKKAVMHLNE